MNAQDIYGTPAAYQLGQGTQRTATPGSDDPIPLHESVEKELQFRLIYSSSSIKFFILVFLSFLVLLWSRTSGLDLKVK